MRGADGGVSPRPVTLPLGDERAHLDGGVERVTDVQRGDRLDDGVDPDGIDSVAAEQTRRRLDQALARRDQFARLLGRLGPIGDLHGLT